MVAPDFERAGPGPSIDRKGGSRHRFGSLAARFFRWEVNNENLHQIDGAFRCAPWCAVVSEATADTAHNGAHGTIS